MQPLGRFAQVEQYRRKLELLAEGKLVEAMRVVTGGSSATAKAVGKIGGDDVEGAVFLPSKFAIFWSFVMMTSKWAKSIT